MGNEGMPSRGNPFVKGNLHILFRVRFPDDNELSKKQITALQKLLPDPDMEVDYDPEGWRRSTWNMQTSSILERVELSQGQMPMIVMRRVGRNLCNVHNHRLNSQETNRLTL